MNKRITTIDLKLIFVILLCVFCLMARYWFMDLDRFSSMRCNFLEGPSDLEEPVFLRLISQPPVDSCNILLQNTTFVFGKAILILACSDSEKLFSLNSKTAKDSNPSRFFGSAFNPFFLKSNTFRLAT